MNSSGKTTGNVLGANNITSRCKAEGQQNDRPTRRDLCQSAKQMQSRFVLF
jgi:hypothetical protein